MGLTIVRKNNKKYKLKHRLAGKTIIFDNNLFFGRYFTYYLKFFAKSVEFLVLIFLNKTNEKNHSI